MFRLPALAIFFAVVSAPASAADLRATHEMVTMPPGKLHAIAFRPLKAPKSPACVAGSHDPAGNRIDAVRPAERDCARAASLARASRG